MKTLRPHGVSGPFKSRRSLRTQISAAVAAALCLKPSLLVYAADASDAAPDQTVTADQSTPLQEIVVTATRRNESIQNIPYNLAAVSSDMIQELQLTKIDDVAHYVPGVNVEDTGAWSSSNIIVRGLNTTELGTEGGPNGVGGAVATYFGEVPLFFDFHLLDINRVEALLGPQGTLYGAGTLGGVIRYLPNLPDLYDFEAIAHVRGTYQQKAAPQEGYDTDGVLNLPLINGKLAVRFVLGYYYDPGFINFTRLLRDPGVSNPQPNLNDPSDVAANLYTARGVNFDHTLTARTMLLYKPNDGFDAQLTYMHEHTTTDGTQTTHDPVLGTGPFDSAFRVLNTADRKADLVSLVLTGHLGFADLVSASSVAQRRIDQQFDNTDAFLTSSSYSNFPKFVEYDDTVIMRHLYTEELRLVSHSDRHLQYIFGGFGEYYTDRSLDYAYMPGYAQYLGIDRPDALNSYANDVSNQADKAIFGELTYHFTSAFQMTVGMRWFKDAITEDLAQASPFETPPDDIVVTTKHVTGSPVDSSLYKFNPSFRFTPDLMAYATVSDGYRFGGLNSNPLCQPGELHNCLTPNELVVKPDRTRNYELGVRSTWFDKRLLFNGDVWFIRWNDIRVGTTSPNGTPFVTNGTAAETYGFESQFQAELPFHLSLFGQYTYTEAHLTELAPNIINTYYGTFNAYPGDRLPSVPRQMFGARLRYSRSLPHNYAFYATYGMTGQSNFLTSIGDDDGSGEKIGGYAVHNASLGLSRNNWTATLFVENLLNKYAYTGMEYDESYKGLVLNGTILRAYYHSVMAPRLFGLEFTVHL